MNKQKLPKGWKEVELKDITECLDNKRVPLNSSQRKKIQGSIPYYGANGKVDSINKHIFDEELLLLAEDGGSWGRNQTCAYIISGKSWVNNHAHVLRMKNETNINYLMYFLNLNDLNIFISGTTRGKLNQRKMNKIPVILPPFSTQKKIVSILEKAETLKQKVTKTEKFLDEYLKSIFCEIFDNKDFPVVKLNELTSKISSGSTPLGGSKNYLNNGDILFIRSQNVLMNKFSKHDKLYISKDIHNNMKRTWVKNQDVLLNITGASIGRIAIYMGEDNKANVNQHVCIIRVKDLNKINPIYLNYYFSSSRIQKYIKLINAGGTREALNYTQIKNFDIILPPLPLQKKFAKIVKRVENLKENVKKTKQNSEELFNSLMSKAFKGELVI